MDLAVIDLPDLIQSLGQSGRTGVLRVSGAGRTYSVHFDGGVIKALTAPDPMLVDALGWLDLTTADHIKKADLGDLLSQSDAAIARELVMREVVPEDGIRDAIDILIEEGFTEFLTWRRVQFDFLPQDDSVTSEWASYQIELGTNVPPGGMLMEALRRIDELKRLKGLVPSRWDILVRDSGNFDLKQFNREERRVLRSWTEGRPAGAIMQLSLLPPWQRQVVIGTLVERDVFRLGDSQDLIVYGDRARRAGQNRTAEGFYRRAVERGSVAGRIYLALAELAERREDHDQAAVDYLHAAEGVADSNPIDGVMALRQAMVLGADQDQCLKQLLQIYRRLGEHDDAIDVSYELADYYVQQERLDEAIAVVREAQLLGADMVDTGQKLAALTLRKNDIPEAIVHLEQVIREASESGRKTAAAESREQLLELEPGRCNLALTHAEALVELGQSETAAHIIRRSLNATEQQATEDLVIRMRELLGQIDANDQDNQKALIDSYHARDNRAGAANHLIKLADNQERSGEDRELLSTLEQILALGGEVAQTLVRMARIQDRLGLSQRASISWQHAIDATIESGDLTTAQQWVQEALVEHSEVAVLQERAAAVANRSGQREVATKAYQSAALLYFAVNDYERADVVFAQLQALVPDDFAVRLLRADVALYLATEDSLEYLAEFTRYAARNENLGIAVAYTQHRVGRTPAPALVPRAELVELLRRTGNYQQELAEGQRLFADMIEAGALEQALELMQRLVASHSRNPDLVRQLGELHEGIGDDAASERYLRHAVVLYQQEDRRQETAEVLDSLQRIAPKDPEVSRARSLFDQNLAINWQAIREEREAANKRRIAGEAAQELSNSPHVDSSSRYGARRVQSTTDFSVMPGTGAHSR